MKKIIPSPYAYCLTVFIRTLVLDKFLGRELRSSVQFMFTSLWGATLLALVTKYWDKICE